MEQKHGLPYFRGWPLHRRERLSGTHRAGAAPRGSGKEDGKSLPTAENTRAEGSAAALWRAPSERVEKLVTDLLNELIRCPDRIQPAVSQVVGAACGKTREYLTTALERQPIDEDNARALLLQLAAEQYGAIGNTEYETVRLRWLLTGRKPMTEPDAELLQSAVSKVRVTNNCVTVTLKNGQTIERRDEL